MMAIFSELPSEQKCQYAEHRESKQSLINPIRCVNEDYERSTSTVTLLSGFRPCTGWRPRQGAITSGYLVSTNDNGNDIIMKTGTQFQHISNDTRGKRL